MLQVVEYVTHPTTKHMIIVKTNMFAVEQDIWEQPVTALRSLDRTYVLAGVFVASNLFCQLFP